MGLRHRDLANLPAIGKNADGFVTGAGHATSISSAENRKFVADFEAANKSAPDLYGADSAVRVLLQGSGGEGGSTGYRQGPCAAMRGLQWSTP